MNKVAAKIRNAELNNLALSLQQSYIEFKDELKDAFLDKQFARLELLSEQFNEAINRTRFTRNLDGKDKVRDEKIRYINSVLKGYLCFPEPEIVAAAEYLYKIFSQYTVAINDAGYVEQSGYIMSLLKDFEQDEAQAQIKKLASFDRIVEDLSAAQDDFQRAYLLSEMEAVNQSNKVSASMIKPQLLSLINDKIISYLNTMSEEEQFLGLSSTIEQIIKDINVNVNSRLGKEKEEEETEE